MEKLWRGSIPELDSDVYVMNEASKNALLEGRLGPLWIFEPVEEVS